MTDNLLSNIRVGFYSRLVGTATALRTKITQTIATVAYYNLYFHQVPVNVPSTGVPVQLPVVIMDLLPIKQERDTATKFYRFIVQFQVGANNQAEAEEIATDIKDLLEDNENLLTINHSSTIQLTQQPIELLGLIDGVWNINVSYEALIQQ